MTGKKFWSDNPYEQNYTYESKLTLYLDQSGKLILEVTGPRDRGVFTMFPEGAKSLLLNLQNLVDKQKEMLQSRSENEIMLVRRSEYD